MTTPALPPVLIVGVNTCPPTEEQDCSAHVTVRIGASSIPGLRVVETLDRGRVVLPPRYYASTDKDAHRVQAVEITDHALRAAIRTAALDALKDATGA